MKIYNIAFFVILLSIQASAQKKSDKSPFDTGIAKMEREKYQAAIEDFTIAIAANANHSQAYHKRAFCKAMVQDHQGALEDYNTCIELDPEDKQAYSNRGIARLNLRDKTGACDDWKKAVSMGFLEAQEMLNEYCD